jgi:hypothetical protein
MENQNIDNLLQTLKKRDQEIKDLYKEIHETQQANIKLCKSYNDLKHELAMHHFNDFQKLKNK